MKIPLILLTAGFYRSETGLCQRRLYQSYADGVSAAGALPLLALGGVDEAAALADRCDALLLTGGEDIAPARFGEPAIAACGEPDLLRDERELALFAAFSARKKPIAGICRGLQLVNVALGGTLRQDLPVQCGITGHDSTVHP
ncbi:MAG: gamma-glutamyl-gamma-aminobutyrate hydrolase family protein, partial [Oscillospiraceae bacterium]